MQGRINGIKHAQHQVTHLAGFILPALRTTHRVHNPCAIAHVDAHVLVKLADALAWSNSQIDESAGPEDRS